jgi:hypothetical protein
MPQRKTSYWDWLYDHVETWWGDQLTFELAEKIGAAPRKHIASFSDSLTRYPGVSISARIPPGTLRPLVAEPNLRHRTVDGVSLALRLLLYSHEAAIESEFLNILYLVSEPQEIDESSRRDLRRTLRQLAMLRPLALQGVVHVAHVHSPVHHPSHAWSGWQQELLADPEIFKLASELPSLDQLDRLIMREDFEHAELVEALTRDFGVLHYACWLAERREAAPLARSEAEMKILSAILNRQISDGRYSTLTTLARLPVPVFSLNAQVVARLRSDDEAFAGWRESLGSALEHIHTMPDSADMNDAAEIVHCELSSATAGIRKSIKKSPLLESAKSGVAKFGIDAVGAATVGLVSGNPWAALVSGASAQAADAVRSYINSVNGRRSDRLVLDLVAAFMPTKDENG